MTSKRPNDIGLLFVPTPDQEWLTTSSPLAMELQRREATGRSIFQAFLRQTSQGPKDQPQLYRAFKGLGWEDAFHVFLAAFRGNMKSGETLAALHAAEVSGHFDRRWLEDLAAGRLTVVAELPRALK